MKEKFKPRLTTINEEYCIPDYIIHKMAGLFPHEQNENRQYYGERIKNGTRKHIDKNCWALIITPKTFSK